MISSIFNTLVFYPFYNGLIFLINLLHFADVGVVIIIFTIIVKIILLPLSIKAAKAQIKMKGVQKDLDAIKLKYKDNKEEQSKKTIEYYKEKGINPFAGIFVLLIQIPIILGLYRVFLKSSLPQINTAWLYPFVLVPTSINMVFLNLINISQKSIVLAIIAGATMYIQMHMANLTQQIGQTKGSTQEEMIKNMTSQMKYVFPILIAFIAYSISAAVALYLITSNVFAIGQEMWIKKKYHTTPIVV